MSSLRVSLQVSTTNSLRAWDKSVGRRDGSTAYNGLTAWVGWAFSMRGMRAWDHTGLSAWVTCAGENDASGRLSLLFIMENGDMRAGISSLPCLAGGGRFSADHARPYPYAQGILPRLSAVKGRAGRGRHV